MTTAAETFGVALLCGGPVFDHSDHQAAVADRLFDGGRRGRTVVRSVSVALLCWRTVVRSIATAGLVTEGSDLLKNRRWATS